ncbi:MAG: ribonuclease E/G [Alphaproteobacteria bacterium]
MGEFSILYETCPHHSRAALFDDAGRLLSLSFDEPSRPYGTGAVVLGRVRAMVPALYAAFVDIGDTHDGFLPFSTIPKNVNITEGQELLVRIARGSDSHKGAKLDARVAVKAGLVNGHKAPALIQPQPNALRRAIMDAGDTPVQVWVVDERFVPATAGIAPPERVHCLNKQPENDLLGKLDEQLDLLGQHNFAFAGGMLTVDITKALTAIDVDAGSLEGVRGSSREGGIRALNLRAATEVVRLCSLLDLGGNVIVDFITMRNPQARKELQQFLKDEFAQYDMAKVEIFPMSRFGLVEINRERAGAMKPELLATPAYVAGRILLQLWRHVGGTPREVAAHPDVIEHLKKHLTTAACWAAFGTTVNFSVRKEWDVTKFAVS